MHTRAHVRELSTETTIKTMQFQRHTFSVAPMMEWTDRHCRVFHRQLTRYALLYTEMITADAILHGKRDRLLGFDACERPVALQLGGSDPSKLARARSVSERVTRILARPRPSSPSYPGCPGCARSASYGWAEGGTETRPAEYVQRRKRSRFARLFGTVDFRRDGDHKKARSRSQASTSSAEQLRREAFA